MTDLAIRPVGFGALLNAEWFALRRRIGVQVLVAVWALQVIVFAYLVELVVYRSTAKTTTSTAVLTGLLPASTGSYVLGSLPLYGGPVMLCIGAVIGSGDYRFGTLRTLLSRYPNRVSFTLARFSGMTLSMLAVSIMTMLLSLVCSGIVAKIQGLPLDYPNTGRLLLGLGAIWLVTTAWGGLGFLVGILTRNLAAAIVIGLAWTLIVETVLFGGLGSVVPAINAIRVILLSPSSASLAYALGAQASTPGVTSTASGPVATLVLVGYVLLSALISAAVLRRRDIS